jgi:Mn-dependent DtxR family transcriptional regulator
MKENVSKELEHPGGLQTPVKIVKEDIIRIIGEEKSKKFPSKDLKSEIKVSRATISEAIKGLENDGLIEIEEELLELTEKGQAYAETIIKKHSIIEDYFKRKRDRKEAHEAADILEHYISMEVCNNMEKLSTLKEESFSLTESKANQENLITDIECSSGGLFERIVSMGIFPGEKVRIMYKIPDGFVVSVGRKKIALGEDMAKKIRVLG